MEAIKDVDIGEYKTRSKKNNCRHMTFTRKPKSGKNYERQQWHKIHYNMS